VWDEIRIIDPPVTGLPIGFGEHPKPGCRSSFPSSTPGPPALVLNIPTAAELGSWGATH